jgi:transcriptional regulator with AAA-type ATPase domain
LVRGFVMKIKWRSAAGKAFAAKLLEAERSTKPVLLLGPTGSGKTYWAEELHWATRPAGRLACYRGSDECLSGVFSRELYQEHLEAAKGGTFLLDAVQDLSADGQKELATLLQEGIFRRETRLTLTLQTPSCNGPLQASLLSALERAPFFFMDMPSMPDLREDWLAIAQSLLDNVPQSKHRVVFTPDALDWIASHSWKHEIWEMKGAVQVVAQKLLDIASWKGAPSGELLLLTASAMRAYMKRCVMPVMADPVAYDTWGREIPRGAWGQA